MITNAAVKNHSTRQTIAADTAGARVAASSTRAPLVNSSADRDRHRVVVVLHVGVAEQLVQREPGVRGTLADPAVGDRRLGLVDAGLLVQLTQLVVVPEGAVLVGRLAPRHVDRGRDVPGPLCLLL